MEVLDEPPPTTGRAGGDPWKLRGIPVIGVQGGIGGAIPGTKPETEVA